MSHCSIGLNWSNWVELKNHSKGWFKVQPVELHDLVQFLKRAMKYIVSDINLSMELVPFIAYWSLGVYGEIPWLCFL